MPVALTTAGLSTAEARERLARVRPNAVAEERLHPVQQFLKRFWAPIPWLLEATILLQLFLGERLEAAVIGGLLLLNGVIGTLQEGRAQNALTLLRRQLRIEARVRRDGQWSTISAAELVPGDVVHLRQGGVVPADVRVIEGDLLLDQSALTGESAAVPAATGATAYAGGLVRSGEATGEIIATGERTFFGKTAELVRTAHAANRQEHELITVVRDLFVINAALVVIVLGVAHTRGLSVAEVLPLALALLLASIPVALPATFTLTAALGALELLRRGVLVTRLSALHDLAAATILCSDKTGTLTRNEATVAELRPADGIDEAELLRAAAWASDPSGQDPVDGAIVAAAATRGWTTNAAERIAFKPFDPATKRAEAVYREENGTRSYVKGAAAGVATWCGISLEGWEAVAQELASKGRRVLAVATQTGAAAPRFIGLLGLEDAVRVDSRVIVEDLGRAGLRVVMVTGDNAFTARTVATQVAIPADVCPMEALRGDLDSAVLAHSVFAGVLPEDKYRLVRAFQRQGETVAMCGDGVNDAPALRQTEAGLAMANATDVAKAAAAIVLTRPGLGDVRLAIEVSRRVYQRVVTYTLNTLSKKFELMLLLALGFLFTNQRLLTPLLMVLIIFLNDFATMALATDRMSVASVPNRWRTGPLVIASAILGGWRLLFSLGVFAIGYYGLRLAPDPLQTLTFATVVLGNQAGIYLLRERGRAWAMRPSRPLLLSTLGAIGATVVLALGGFLMAPIPPAMLVAVVAAMALYFAALDGFKRWLFVRLALR